MNSELKAAYKKGIAEEDRSIAVVMEEMIEEMAIEMNTRVEHIINSIAYELKLNPNIIKKYLKLIDSKFVVNLGVVGYTDGKSVIRTTLKYRSETILKNLKKKFIRKPLSNEEVHELYKCLSSL